MHHGPKRCAALSVILTYLMTADELSQTGNVIMMTVYMTHVVVTEEVTADVCVQLWPTLEQLVPGKVYQQNGEKTACAVSLLSFFVELL